MLPIVNVCYININIEGEQSHLISAELLNDFFDMNDVTMCELIEF